MSTDGNMFWMKPLGTMARRPALAVVLTAAIAISLATISVVLHGVPRPRVHDEFSYLLAADTFAGGQLTNPTHPQWRYFETMHVLQNPTYQSMYPPGQGVMLALGQKIGHPFIGVLLSIGLMAGALTWMLRGWLPGRWALIGGLLAVAQFVLLGREYGGGVIGYWSQSYWGGAVAATGGALVLGAWPRIRRGARLRDVIWMGLGLMILACSRPYEGLAASLLIVVVLLIWLLRPSTYSRRTFVRIGISLALIGIMTLAGLMYYNQRVTGNCLKPPFLAHHEQYCVFPVLLCQQPRPEVEWNNATLEEFHGQWEPQLYDRHKSVAGFTTETARKLYRLWLFYLGPLLTIPFLAGIFLARRRRARLAAGVLGVTLVAVLLCVRAAPHYLAPAAGAVVLLVAVGLRDLYFVQLGGRPVGRWLAVAIFVACWILALGALALPMRGNAEPSRFMDYREDIRSSLEESGGRHLVLVDYGPQHSIHNEWVYNAANIDASPVVWARDLGPDGNTELLDYFHDRIVWHIHVDDDSNRPMLKDE